MTFDLRYPKRYTIKGMINCNMKIKDNVNRGLTVVVMMLLLCSSPPYTFRLNVAYTILLHNEKGGESSFFSRKTLR